MLEVSNISKDFKGFSLKDISFRVENGDYLVLLGPSGAGKSLILSLLAGFIRQDSGSIYIDGTDISHISPHKRHLGLVFQKGYVFPHLTVEKNIAYPLMQMGVRDKRIQNQVYDFARRFDLEGILKRYPQNLSGGELQRVALARIMAMDPRILLLDEPLSSLDVQYKYDFRNLLKRINNEGKAIIHVTHDHEEALRLASHVAILKAGRIIQQGTVGEVFGNPQSEFAAHFIGHRNFFEAKVVKKDTKTFARLENGLDIQLLSESKEDHGYVIIDHRDILLSSVLISSSARNSFPGRVINIQRISDGYEVVVDCGIPLHAVITEESKNELRVEPGMEIWTCFKASSVRFIPG